jgi:hypothetical protein
LDTRRKSVPRRSRIVLVALLALAAGAGGVFLVLKRRGTADLPAEARRNFFLSIIAIPINDRQPHAIARNKAAAAYERIRSGTPFDEVASSESEEGTSKMMGGFVGLIETQKEEMNAFRGAAQMLDEGDVKGPVYDGHTWLVLKRHPYEEGRALERKWLIPCYGFRIAHREIEGGGPERTREQARAQANSAVEELRAGKITIAEARARYGEPDDAPATGWMDLLRLSPQSEPLYRVLAAVPEGGVPDPLDTARGILVLRRGHFFRSIVRNILVQHIESENRPTKEMKLRPEAKARAQEALTRALADPARWDDLVHAYTDELFSVEDRGYIGCLAPGSLDASMAALETAILATPPGKIHPHLVETPFGYHVVWRVD